MATIKIKIDDVVVREMSFVDPRGSCVIHLGEEEMAAIASVFAERGSAADVRIVYTGNLY